MSGSGIGTPVTNIGGTSLDDLVELVRRRLGDFPQRRVQSETGDGVETHYKLRESPYLASGATATVAGSAATLTVDYDSGWATFTSAPTGEILISYSTVVWSDERIEEAINSAIDELFGKFYIWGVNDDLWSEGGADVIAQNSSGVDLGPEDRITRVEYWTGSRWVRTDRWSVQVQGASKVIVFEQAPIEGINFRISYITRPGNITGTQTLEHTAGLPTRAKEPIILLACSGLIVERMHHRIRDDRGHNTQADNTVKSYEIQNDAQFLRAQAMVIAQSLKMDSMQGRVTL